MKAKGHGKGDKVTFYVLHTCIHYTNHKLDVMRIWDACIYIINVHYSMTPPYKTYKVEDPLYREI